MFDKLDVFRTSMGLATHAARRQSLIAQNVANADTPGYRARDLPGFAETYRAGAQDGMRATRTGHLVPGGGVAELPAAREVYRPGAASPNGNNVSLEAEMMTAAEVKSAHDRALTIYQTSLGILRSSLGRGR